MSELKQFAQKCHETKNMICNSGESSYLDCSYKKVSSFWDTEPISLLINLVLIHFSSVCIKFETENFKYSYKQKLLQILSHISHLSLRFICGPKCCTLLQLSSQPDHATVTGGIIRELTAIQPITKTFVTTFFRCKHCNEILLSK